LSFKLGIAYQQAQLCQNFTVFNSLVDQYNAWVRQHFGEHVNLLMSKTITASAAPITVPRSPAISPNFTGVVQRRPFNASSDLSKFGRQQVFTEIPPRSRSWEYTRLLPLIWVLKNFQILTTGRYGKSGPIFGIKDEESGYLETFS
jgi:hypothetical protein